MLKPMSIGAAARAMLLGGSLLLPTGGAVAAGSDVEPMRATFGGVPADTLRDPALRMGTLPNGMRYYVRANTVPARRAHLWLAVRAGSVHEDDDQLGYAHFLEHMAFNGTRHFPRHAIIDFVEASGMRFGADLNAHTSFAETVYKLTVPTDDPSFVDRGLAILEDWAGGGITLDSLEVVAERGVVLGEWRIRALRDSTAERVTERIYDVYFGGSRMRERLPIGTPESIEAANPAPLRRFYEDWYRPDRIAVIAVGDFDPDAMEREIRSRFGKITARGEPRAEIEVKLARSAEPVVEILREDGVGSSIHFAIPAPERPRGTAAAVRQELVSTLLFQHLQRKLLRLREEAQRPFIDAQLGPIQLLHPGDMIVGSAIAFPDSLERSLAAVATEIERVAQHGIPVEILEREKSRILRRVESRVAGAAARTSTAYADEYTQHFISGEGVLLSAAQELELAREVLPTITPEVIAGAAAMWRDAAGMRVLVLMPKITLGFAPPTRESILAIFASIRNTPLAPETTSVAALDAVLMERPPTPGKIVSERRHAAAGITEWTLSNGAKVLFKQSYNHPDEVLVRAWSPGGFSLVPDSLFFSSGRMAAVIMTEAAGYGDRGRDELLEQLSATTGVRRLKVDIGHSDESIEVAGSPRELETLFQLLHLQFTSPKLDSAALEKWAGYAKYRGARNVTHDALAQYIGRSNPRLRPITTHLAEMARVEEVMAVHRDRFGNAGDFTFVVVGAVTPDEVRPLVERYIASLPATGVREEPKHLSAVKLAGETKQSFDVFSVPRAQSLLVYDGVFPTKGDEYFSERQRFETLGLILEKRLRNRLREELSGTYGVTVVSQTYRLDEERYRIQIGFDAAPERNMELRQEMLRIVDDLRENGADEIELEHTARYQHRLLETRLQNNQYWLDQITLYNRLGLPLDRIVSPYPTESVTAAALKETTNRYMPADTYYLFAYMPKREVMTEYKKKLQAKAGSNGDSSADERKRGEARR